MLSLVLSAKALISQTKDFVKFVFVRSIIVHCTLKRDIMFFLIDLKTSTSIDY